MEEKIRSICLFGDITTASVNSVISALEEVESSQFFSSSKIILNSAGGDVASAFALYDHIKLCKKKVDIIVEGKCESSALFILQAAKKRLATENSTFMYHDMEVDFGNMYFKELKRRIERSQYMQDLMEKIIMEKTGISAKKLEEFKPRKFFTPEEALKLGFIDEIIKVN